MGKAIFLVIKIIVVMIGAAWAFTLLRAQLTCSLFAWIGPHCTDGRGEIWMLPLFTAAFGVPAVIASIFIVRAAMIQK